MAMNAGIGHNSGQVVEPGHTWRAHVWRKARADLLPRLPIEVVRRRVKRAAELGLPYKTYAGIRASTGHDLIGFLFSSNALRVFRENQAIPPDRVAVLAARKDCLRVGLAHRPVPPAALIPPLDRAFEAPVFGGTWGDLRADLRAVVRDCSVPADRFVLIGDTAAERDWSVAVKAAGYLPSDSYFVQVSG